jgi:Mg-chelatase subunit ChlD
MSPGMLHLAEDREVTAMIVITDGRINYPSELPQIDVLWVLTESASSFEPPYGTVLQMK